MPYVASIHKAQRRARLFPACYAAVTARYTMDESDDPIDRVRAAFIHETWAGIVEETGSVPGWAGYRCLYSGPELREAFVVKLAWITVDCLIYN